MSKGSFSISWVAGIILVILGAAVLIIFFSGLFDEEEINRETCKISVSARGTLPLGEGYVPLKCQTKKVCITGKILGKGDCDEFMDSDKVFTKRVSNSRQGLEQIEKVYAQETLECWNMMGMGELSLAGQPVAQHFGVGEIYPSCVICSRVAIDTDSLDKVPFEKMDVQDYMSTHAVPGTEKSYFDFMFGEGIVPLTINKVPVLNDEESNEDIGYEGFDRENLEETEDVDELTEESAILFMQISAPNHWESFRNSVGATLGFGTAFVGVKGVVRGGMWAVRKTGWIGASVAAMGALYQQGSVAVNRAVAAGYCSDVKFGDEARSGCSAVRITDYELDSIGQYCQVIESIP